RFATIPVASRAKVIVIFKALVEHGVSLALRHGFESTFVVIPQADVFHVRLLSNDHLRLLASAFFGSSVEEKLAYFAWHIAGDGSFLRPRKCLIQIGGLQYPESAHVLLGLGVRSVSDQHLAIAPLAQRLRISGRGNTAGELPGAGGN